MRTSIRFDNVICAPKPLCIKFAAVLRSESSHGHRFICSYDLLSSVLEGDGRHIVKEDEQEEIIFNRWVCSSSTEFLE